MAIDQERLDGLVGQLAGEFGVAFSAATMVLGDRLGLYQAMAGAGPISPAELARQTGTVERLIAEWLAGQAASGYVDYDPATGSYELTEEQAAVFAAENEPSFMLGAFQIVASTLRDLDKIEAAYRGDGGLGWHEHDALLFVGTERLFRPGYAANLVTSWVGALDGVRAKLEAGATVADVGCGLGASTILLAQAFPRSTFVGFDFHTESIDLARKAAAEGGVSDRVRFEVAGASSYPGTGYDLVAVFDALHDLGDPVGAARHILSTLAPDGTWLLVEPSAGDRIEDNFNPVGRIFYSASAMICVPSSLAQDVGLGLGAQAGEIRIREVVTQGGFTRFRRAAETPFNLVFEARP